MLKAVSEFSTAELKDVLVRLASVASERAGKHSSPEDDDATVQTCGIVLYDAEKAKSGKELFVGPYAAMNIVMKSLLSKDVKGKLSIRSVPHQFSLIRAYMSPRSPLLTLAGNNAARLKELDDLLMEASALVTALVGELVEGWKTDLIPRGESAASEYTVRPGATAADFWNWNPSKVSYSIMSVKNGRHVPSYCADFVRDFVSSGKTEKSIVYKQHVLQNHPYVQTLLSEVLKERDDHVKRGTTQITTNGKQTRHPSIGPLEIHDYRLYEDDIEKATQGCADSRALLETTFEGVPFDKIAYQHDFEKRFVRLCDLVSNAFFKYIANGTIFGDDNVSLHAMFCLTRTQNFEGRLAETSNRVETWYIHMLSIFIKVGEPRLKERYYVPHSKFEDVSEEDNKRWGTGCSVDEVFLKISSSLNGWMQTEIIRYLSTFYLCRNRAFVHAGLHPSKSRDDVLKDWSINRNATDSYDDLLKSRPSKPGKKKAVSALTSWHTPGSITEETNMDSDALIIAIVVLGREEAKRRFPDLLETHSIEFGDAGACADTGSSSSRAVRMFDAEDTQDRFGDLSSKLKDRPNQERLEKAEAAMDIWLPLRQRCTVETLLGRIDGHTKALTAAARNAKIATEITRMVSTHYERIRSSQADERRRIGMIPSDVELSLEDRLIIDRQPDVEHAEALSSAVSTTFRELSGPKAKNGWFCTFEESVAAVAGSPPTWKWETNEARITDTEVAQTQQLAFIERTLSVLGQYRERMRSHPPTSSVFDLVTPINEYVSMITASRSINDTDDEEDDWVGFSEPIGRVKASEKVLTWFETRVETAARHVDEFVSTIANVVYYGFLIALEWCGVFFEHNMHVVESKKPRMGLAVAYVLRFLSCVSAHNAIAVTESKEEHADVLLTGKQNTCVVSVLNDATSCRIDVCSVDMLIQFAKSSEESWKCFCTLGCLTKSLLVYNRELTFNCTQWQGNDSINFDTISVSFCSRVFFVMHDEDVERHRSDVAAYRIALAPEVNGYPPLASWEFHDTHFSTPAAFKVLMTWLPDSVHFVKGFFPFSGVRDRPDKKNGFLNVQDTLKPTSTANGTQYWNGFCAHSLARTHGRIPIQLDD